MPLNEQTRSENHEISPIYIDKSDLGNLKSTYWTRKLNMRTMKVHIRI
jgi:hypothetical protein